MRTKLIITDRTGDTQTVYGDTQTKELKIVYEKMTAEGYEFYTLSSEDGSICANSRAKDFQDVRESEEVIVMKRMVGG